MSKSKAFDEYDDLNEEDFLNGVQDDYNEASESDYASDEASGSGDRYDDYDDGYGDIADDYEGYDGSGKDYGDDYDDGYGSPGKGYGDDYGGSGDGYDDGYDSPADDYDHGYDSPGEDYDNGYDSLEESHDDGYGSSGKGSGFRLKNHRKARAKADSDKEDFDDLDADLYDDAGGYDDEYYDDDTLEEEGKEKKSSKSGSLSRQRRTTSIRKSSPVDDFREWLSDNLRYFMLGGGALLLILVVVFAVRGCGHRDSDTGSGEAVDPVSVVDASGAAASGAETETIANPLTEATSGIVSLVNDRFDAMASGNIDTVRSLQTDLSAVDEARIQNDSQSVDSYTIKEIYTKTGREDKSYVTYVSYDTHYTGYNTGVPRLEELYVITTGDGSLIVDSDALTDPDISAYMSQLRNDADVQELIARVQSEEREALASDAELSSFLSGMGEAVPAPVAAQDAPAPVSEPSQDAEPAAEGPSMTVTADAVNLRSDPGGEDVIDVIQYGSSVTVLGTAGENNDWYEVQYNGQRGYVYSEYLE